MAPNSLHRDEFSVFINEAEDRHKGPDIFWRKPVDNFDELRVLRRWNSHSPSVADVIGGGYFLRWQGKGTVIDPGCSFLRLFRQRTSYSFHDINMIIATHDHIDHCQDLSALIGLFRQFNKWLVTRNHKAPQVWDMLISYGVAEHFGSVLNHPDNAPFLFWRKVLANNIQRIEEPQAVPAFLKDAGRYGYLETDQYLKEFLPRAITTLTTRYAYSLAALPAQHKELLGASTAFGLRFHLNATGNAMESREPICTIVISGDTHIRGIAEPTLVNYYGNTDLLVLHVGGMEKPGTLNESDHLCFQGVVEILRAVAKEQKAPKLVILTEWGYEFGRLGLNGRTRFTSYVADELNDPRHGLAVRFHAAVADPDDLPPVCPDGAIVILPADIDLKISLPALKVFAHCENSNEEFHDYVDYARVYAKESVEQIDYLFAQE